MLGRSRPGGTPSIASNAWLAVMSLGIGAFAVVAALTRQAGVPRYRTVWAEDGAVFGQCPLFDPFPPGCFVTPYDGWLHLVPRSLGWVAASLPLEWFSYAMAGLAAVAVGACAALVARAVAQAGRSLVGGAIAGAGLVIVYPAGAEVLGNVTNLPWVMFVASITLVSCSLLGRRLDRLDIALVLLTLASTPFGLLILAMLAVDLALPGGAKPGRRALLVGAGLIVCVQLAAGMLSPRNEIPDLPITLLSPVGWLADLVFIRGPFGGRGIAPGWLPGVMTVVALAIATGAALRRRSDRPVEFGGRPWWTPLLALAGVVLSCAAVFAASTYLNRHVTARYDYVPASGMFVVLALALALTWQQAGTLAIAASVGLRRILLGAGVAVLLAGAATTFRVATGASAGPSYPAALRDARLGCGAGVPFVSVVISPLPQGSVATAWTMDLPCSRLGG